MLDRWVHAAFFVRRRLERSASLAESPLAGRDYLWLSGAIACGGVAAPALLLWELAGSAASQASPLLSTEGALTVLISAVAFREHGDRRVWIGAGLMLPAAALISWSPGEGVGPSPHALAIVGACALWGVDNNLTRPIPGEDPVAIAISKGLAAGATHIALAGWLGENTPSFALAAGAMALGSLAYGASLLLYILALRKLGSARAAALWNRSLHRGGALALAAGRPCHADAPGGVRADVRRHVVRAVRAA